MPLFFRTKDEKFFQSVTKELVNNIIDTTVSVFKLNLINTETDLYGEALNKIYYKDVTVAGLIDHEDPTLDYDSGMDLKQTITIYFQLQELKNLNLYLEVGDIIEYDNKHFEIDSVIDNKYLGGQPDKRYAITVNCVLTKKVRTLIDEIKIADENRQPLLSTSNTPPK